jgi:peptidyl-prolyl cis-trans isomerase A (cyclophilin A)
LNRAFATRVALSCLLFAGACGVGLAQADLPDSPGANIVAAPVPTGPVAVFDTSMGRMTCTMFGKQTPLTVQNFIALAEGTKDWTDPVTHKVMKNTSLYNGTIFHRVVPGFMIQGGDPTGTGTGDPGYFFADEFVPGLGFEVPGRLAMANAGPDTNGSQFFITTEATPFLDGKHTIFGTCDAASLAVARSIALVPTGTRNKPDTDVKLYKVTIVDQGQPLPPLPKAEPASAAPVGPSK